MPYRFDTNALPGETFADPASLPVALLEGTDVSVEIAIRGEGSDIAFRNVFAVRHGAEFTRYFYDYDPLPALAIARAAFVRRYNSADIAGVRPEQPAQRPSSHPPQRRLRRGRLLRRGSGHRGAVDKPGTITWPPKAFTFRAR